MMANPDYQISRGIVLSRSNVEHEGRITYLPIYASWCFKDIYGLISTTGDSDKDTGSFSLETIPV